MSDRIPLRDARKILSYQRCSFLQKGKLALAELLRHKIQVAERSVKPAARLDEWQPDVALNIGLVDVPIQSGVLQRVSRSEFSNPNRKLAEAVVERYSAEQFRCRLHKLVDNFDSVKSIAVEPVDHCITVRNALVQQQKSGAQPS